MNREMRRELRHLPREPLAACGSTIRGVKGHRDVAARRGCPDRGAPGRLDPPFICNYCGLRFNLCSWRPHRHRAGTVWCSRCRQHDGHFRHDRPAPARSRGGRIPTTPVRSSATPSIRARR